MKTKIIREYNSCILTNNSIFHSPVKIEKDNLEGIRKTMTFGCIDKKDYNSLSWLNEEVTHLKNKVKSINSAILFLTERKEELK